MLKSDGSQRTFDNSWFNTLLSSDAAGDLISEAIPYGDGSLDTASASTDQGEFESPPEVAGFQLDLSASPWSPVDDLSDLGPEAHHTSDMLVESATAVEATSSAAEGVPAEAVHADSTSPDILFGETASLTFAPAVAVGDDVALVFDSASLSSAESQGAPGQASDARAFGGTASASDGAVSFDGVSDDSGWGLPVAPDPLGTPTVHKNTAEAGQQITRDNYHWGTTLGDAAGPISFGFRTSAPGYTVNGRDVQGTFSAFTASEETAARAALQLWADAAHITFSDLGDSNNATIEFANYSSNSDSSEAFAFNPTSNDQSVGSYQGDVFINTYYASTSNDSPGTYEFETFIHEIGHSLGLEHPGNYNAGNGNPTYDNSAEYIEDSRQYTLMSYFSETNTGGSFSVNNEAPMVDDIAAIQRLYGANTATRSGDTTYGFYSNAGSPYLISSASQHVAWAIWDGGGNDTLDFSGYSQDATIQLTAESFSNVGGDTDNVSIGPGVTIENAYGGSGSDHIYGNDAANTLIGNAGNDYIKGGGGADHLYGGNDNDTLKGGGGADYLDGGAGEDVADYSYSVSGAAVTIDLAGRTASGGDATGNTLVNIEDLVGTAYNDVLYGTSDSNNIAAGSGNDYVDGYLGNDVLDGGDGTNTLSYTRDLGVIVDLSVTTAQNTGGSGTDTVSNFANLYGSFFNDTLTGDANANYIYGAGGGDVIHGGGGNDTLQAGNPTAYVVKAATILNTTIATAVSLNGVFNTSYAEFIQDPYGTPHATVTATASGQDEYYSFTATANASAHFDIDQTSLGTDTYLKIYASDGTFLTSGDDSGGVIDVGSQSTLDTSLDYTFATAGTYYVDVLSFPGIGPLAAGTQYTLNVSLAGATVVANTVGSVLDGGDGNDTLYGAGGLDTASYADAPGGVTVTLANPGTAQSTGNAGTDTLYSIENLTGSGYSDLLTGDANANVIDGGAGVDNMIGGGGNDTYYVDNAGDVVFETSGGGTDLVYARISYTLAAGQEIERLYASPATSTASINLTGNEINNTLGGNSGANVLNGGAGADLMYGYRGNDVYIVDNAGDRVFEAVGAGNDIVYTSVSYALLAGQEVERLYVTPASGTSAIDLTGNEFANTLAGNAGANQLNGGAGADLMYGYGGNDTYIVDNAGDKVFEAANGGSDIVYASVSYTLAAGQEIERLYASPANGTTAINLTGNAIANTLAGNAGANQLNGGGGADLMYGYGGNDVYIVDNAGDKVFEASGGGADIVYTSVSYALQAGQEVERLYATPASGTTALHLTGNAIANTLAGNAGANVLDGGGGADLMYGYAGNDTYYVDNAGDKVFEAATAGTDTVYASVTYTLTAGQAIENLYADPAAGTAGINLTGNSFANTLKGNAGDNILNGGAGADQMTGGAGNDTYTVDNAGDKVFEAAGGGSDVVYTSVSYALQAGQEVERLAATPAAGTTAINLTGNEFANTLVGNAGANVLNGGAGADLMYGNSGSDTFAFSTALGGGNVDHIHDFTPSNVAVHDRIQLAHSVFTQIATGALAASAFLDITSGAAETSTARLLYNHNTGSISYDSDGLGSTAAVQFAVLDNHSAITLTNADFFVV